MLAECKAKAPVSGQLLSESISETLTDLLGNRAREAVYDYMERNHSIAREEISENTDALFRLFEDFFGEASMNVIGRMIVKKVYSKLNWKFVPEPKLEFNDHLEEIKKRLANEPLDRPRPGI